MARQRNEPTGKSCALPTGVGQWLSCRLMRAVGAAVLLQIAAADFVGAAAGEDTNPAPAVPNWVTEPLSLGEALTIALGQNAAVRAAQKDLEAQHGVSIQTRAIVLPKLQASSTYGAVETEKIETFGPFSPADQNWNAGVRVVQSVFEGGRMWSAVRSARLLREQAMFDYQTVVADTLLKVRESYYDALLATNLIVVRQASLELLEKQLRDTRSRFAAGVVPQFDVLRAEVELANAKPPLIKARNDFRIAKQRLATELGYDVPAHLSEDLPLQLTDKLEAVPYTVNLQAALATALANRTELASLRKVEELRKAGITTARSGYLPTVQIYAGYGARSRQFSADLTDQVHGWEAGAQADWYLFDGLLSKGKVKEARALHERAQIALEDAERRVLLDVRVLNSSFLEAKEVLESQQKVNEQAVEALRLAKSRYDAGTGTQLDVLSAQTALTDARTTYVQALRDYSVVLARLERAIGANLAMDSQPGPAPKP